LDTGFLFVAFVTYILTIFINAAGGYFQFTGAHAVITVLSYIALFAIAIVLAFDFYLTVLHRRFKLFKSIGRLNALTEKKEELDNAVVDSIEEAEEEAILEEQEQQQEQEEESRLEELERKKI